MFLPLTSPLTMFTTQQQLMSVPSKIFFYERDSVIAFVCLLRPPTCTCHLPWQICCFFGKYVSSLTDLKRDSAIWLILWFVFFSLNLELDWFVHEICFISKKLNLYWITNTFKKTMVPCIGKVAFFFLVFLSIPYHSELEKIYCFQTYNR